VNLRRNLFDRRHLLSNGDLEENWWSRESILLEESLSGWVVEEDVGTDSDVIEGQILHICVRYAVKHMLTLGLAHTRMWIVPTVYLSVQDNCVGLILLSSCGRQLQDAVRILLDQPSMLEEGLLLPERTISRSS
jgi:hypothetical protein